MLDQHRAELPDLSRHVALFPSAHSIARFRRLLLAAAQRYGYDGLLAPWCGTVDTWLTQQTTGDYTRIDDTERELLLLEALEPYTDLRARFGTWPLVDALLALFDELNAHRRLPPMNAEELITLLASGYGIGDEHPAPLRAEAELVHTLWNAWNEHLLANRWLDRGLQRLAAFANPPGEAPHHIYMVGVAELAETEAQWLRALLKQRRLTLVLHGACRSDDYQPDIALLRCLTRLELSLPAASSESSDYCRFLDQIYLNQTDLAARAQNFAAEHPQSPALGRLGYFEAGDFEQEARAVELAIRRWHAQGISDVGFVTHDRKLARRVRALLERANLALRDTAGWALSTTSVATALIRWIQCIDQDFAYGPLLDLLKSPFVTLGFERPALDQLIACLERDIIRTHNVNAGLGRYRQLAQKKPTDTTPALLQLFDRLADAAAPLAFARRHQAYSPFKYLTALRTSIETLGLKQKLELDDAGTQVLAVLQQNPRAGVGQGPRLTWAEFQRWLQRELERRRFRPPLPDDGVELLGVGESRCRQFQALVIAGCNRQHLPGTPPLSPFFNDGVRRQLGLPTRPDQQHAPLYDFRRLLEAAPRVLLTRRREERGEALMPSPWVERLLAFQRLAYGVSLDDDELAALLAAPTTRLYVRDAPLAAPAEAPAPSLARTRLPAVITASAHQRLLDCPYQFFAADVLGLRSLEAVSEDIEKSEYGMRVHRMLQAFHTGAPGLPGPWRGPIDAGNCTQAGTLLRDIARVVLAYDTDRRLSARGWQHRWDTFIPVYLAWQEERDRHWRVEASEQLLERPLTIGDRTITLRGRADRLDRGPQGLAILDYKTGSLPDADAVASGEHTQLPFYALLSAQVVTEISYVGLGSDEINTKLSLEGESIAALAAQCESRLRELLTALQQGAPLPAWGDSRVCEYCRFEGLCRKEMWNVDGK